MKAIILSKPKNAGLQELEDLVLDKNNWVKVKVKAVGLCGSDMQKINSSVDPRTYLKTQVLGHEFSGDILELGSSVKGLNIGERVTASPLIPCNSCLQCKEEKYQLCNNIDSIGRTLFGAFSEQVLVPAKNIRKLSDKTSYEEACLTDVIAVAVHNYFLADSPRKKRVLVYGDGAVGLSCLQVYNKYNKVDVIGKHHKTKIKLLGGKFIDSSHISNLKSDSYDIIVETVGRCQDQTLVEAIRLIKPRGRIVVAGVYEIGFIGKISFRNLFYKEAILQGSNSYGVWKGKNEFDIALNMIEKRIINTSEIITHILPLEQFTKGVEHMNNKIKSKAVKIIYKP